MGNTEPEQQNMRMLKSLAPKHCDICGYKYAENDLNLVKQQGPQLVVHLHCNNCGNTYILNIFNPGQGMVGSARSQLNLDLNEMKEIVAFAEKKPVSANEALDAYNLLARGKALDSLLGIK